MTLFTSTVILYTDGDVRKILSTGDVVHMKKTRRVKKRQTAVSIAINGNLKTIPSTILRPDEDVVALSVWAKNDIFAVLQLCGF